MMLTVENIAMTTRYLKFNSHGPRVRRPGQLPSLTGIFPVHALLQCAVLRHAVTISMSVCCYELVENPPRQHLGPVSGLNVAFEKGEQKGSLAILLGWWIEDLWIVDLWMDVKGDKASI